MHNVYGLYPESIIWHLPETRRATGVEMMDLHSPLSNKVELHFGREDMGVSVYSDFQHGVGNMSGRLLSTKLSAFDLEGVSTCLKQHRSEK
jgi:hypothetical protein